MSDLESVIAIVGLVVGAVCAGGVILGAVLVGLKESREDRAQRRRNRVISPKSQGPVVTTHPVLIIQDGKDQFGRKL